MGRRLLLPKTGPGTLWREEATRVVDVDVAENPKIIFQQLKNVRKWPREISV